MGRNVRNQWWLLALVLGLGVAVLAPADGQDELPILRHGWGVLVAGAWTYDFDMGGLLLTDEGPVTGFAFGPGRAEVAYCAPAGREGRWGLWVAAVSFPWPERGIGHPFPMTEAPPRLLWTAPSGVTLRGPVWWAPDGSRIAVRGYRDESGDVVAVDYGSGESVWICRGAEVVDLVWDPAGARVAYVTEEEAGRAVWLQTLPPGEARRLGDGGFDLRWSLDGQSLRWLRPRSREVWVQATWDGGTGEVTEASPQPARPIGTMWSPDGQRCAVLEPSEGGDEKRLLIYSARGTVAEGVPLPWVRPTRLLGWSPDGRLVVVLGDADFSVAVAAMPIADEVRPVVELTGWASEERGAICGYPMEAEAGPPSWSSGCDMLAYVLATKMDERLGAGSDDEFPKGCLVVSPAHRRHLEPLTPEQLEARVVLSNVKNVALALQMYLADNNDVFPPSGESEEVWSILDAYVKNRSVFMRPGTEDEMVTQYLVPPGVRMGDVSDPVRFPVAVVDYLPGVYIVAYADGHAQTREGGDDYWEALMAPWREYWAELEEEGG